MPSKLPATRKGGKPSFAKREQFIAVFRNTGNVTIAAETVGISPSTHYVWMADAAYAERFAATHAEIAGGVKDTINRLGRIGVFVPEIYQGEYCYEKRRRIRCVLADGTEQFEDELIKPHAKVVARRVVYTPDGEKIGLVKHDVACLLKLAAALMPYEYGNRVMVTGKDGAPIQHEVTVKYEKPQGDIDTAGPCRPFDRDPVRADSPQD